MTLWNAINISVPTGLNCNSVFYCVLPTFHTGGLNLYANPIFHLGGTNIIARQYDPGLTLQTLSDPELGVTHFFGVPSIYLFLSQHPDFDHADLRNIQSWGCGGAPMPVALLQRYAARGFIVQLGFGMTETSPTVFLIDNTRSLQKPTSVGKPLLHTRVRVVDAEFKDVSPGAVGEVVISGPNVTPGYWKRPDANQSNFTRIPQNARQLAGGMNAEKGVWHRANGWLRSGDESNQNHQTRRLRPEIPLCLGTEVSQETVDRRRGTVPEAGLQPDCHRIWLGDRRNGVATRSCTCIPPRTTQVCASEDCPSAEKHLRPRSVSAISATASPTVGGSILE
jgi:acyl-CoA synthetase (AMP-forming)/AMP-acid ligase II